MPFQALCVVTTVFVSCGNPLAPSHDVVLLGRISAVRGSCPNLVFTVQTTQVQVGAGILKVGDTLRVVTKPSTKVRGHPSSCSTLARGRRVEVRGRLVSDHVTAVSVIIIVT